MQSKPWLAQGDAARALYCAKIDVWKSCLARQGGERTGTAFILEDREGAEARRFAGLYKNAIVLKAKAGYAPELRRYGVLVLNRKGYRARQAAIARLEERAKAKEQEESHE